MPMPTLQAAPATRSASRIRLENSSRAASYRARRGRAPPQHLAAVAFEHRDLDLGAAEVHA
jgi:hypothetical protein